MPFKPNDIKKDHVLNAIKIIEKEKIELIPASRWLVEINGKLYPTKEVMRYAHEQMNGENLWDFGGGSMTTNFLVNMGFPIIDMTSDPIYDLLNKYRARINSKGLDDELYKWELIAKFKGRPNLESPDFYEEVKSIDFSNLIYEMGKSVIRQLAKEKPNKYKECLSELFNESKPHSQRIIEFQNSVEELFSDFNTDKKLSHHHDERTIATLLTFKYPDNYTFYKDSFYQKYCKLIGVRPKEKGEKYIHYLELIENFIEKYINKDYVLLRSYESHLPGNVFQDKKRKILAQDILYTTLDKGLNEIEMDNSSVYKISMGLFKDNELEHCLAQQKVVVHKNTPAKATSNQKQGEIFENMKIGDLFYLTQGNGFGKMKLFGRITGSAEPASSDIKTEEGWLERSFEIIAKSINQAAYKGQNRWWTPNNFSTIIKIKTGDVDEANKLIFEPYFNIRLLNTSQSAEDNTDKETKMKQLVKVALNQILFGPPGTGKTYYTVNKAIQIANPGFDLNQPRKSIKDEFERLVNEGQIVFTTFHQSMSYEDFIEGIKPIEPKSEQNPGDTLTYKTVDGIFKLICKEATKKSTVIVEEAEGSVEIDEMLLKEGYDKLVSTLPDQKKEDSEILLQTKSDKSKFWLFKNSVNSIVVKAGTKRTNMSIAFSEVSSVYFGRKQPAYKSYTPVIIEKIIRDAGYKEMPVDNSSKNYVFIIDEINRGNISSIFGELITLIEEDKRNGGPEALKAILPYSKVEFSVPNNLYIIGTMNTADRSVEALDTALRRRFSFTEMPPIYDLEGLQYEFAGTSGKEILQKINKRIEKLLDRDHLIGHSYFLLNDGDDVQEELKNAFYRNIIPLLQEYFFGDYAKIGAVLGSGFVLRESEGNQEIFASGFENEDFAEKEIYQIIDYREGQPGNKYIQEGMNFEKAIQLLMNPQISKESEA